jgi:3-hydroxyisobutyrate dehydrogenase
MGKRIGFIGLGIMGGGMAGQLLSKGFGLTVWNRDPSKAADLIARGARAASSPAGVAEGADAVVLMVRDDAAVRQIVFGPAGVLNAARPGTALINMSTTTPTLAGELKAATAEKGCPFLDAPVTGSKAAASSGQLGILVGGSAEDLEGQRDVLSAMGNVTHVGPVGSSAALKLANNALAATIIATIGEAMTLGTRAGLSREVLMEAFSGTAARVCGLKKSKIVNREWSTDFALELMCKDLCQTLETAKGTGTTLPLISAVSEAYERANKAGKGQQDFAVVADRS